MLKFNEEQFLLDGKKTYETRGRIEEVIDAVLAKGFKKLVLTGIGGTIVEMMSVKTIIERYSSLDAVVLNAAEGLLSQPNYINEDAVLLTGSKSGDTIETVDICKYAKEKGATVISFVGSDNNPLALTTDYNIVCDAPGMENTYMICQIKLE